VSNGDLYIVLGCFGRTDDGFISCTGIQNKILLIQPGMPCYNDIMEYLDCCSLFSKMMLEYNSIRHLIFNLQEKFDMPTKKIWTEKQFKLYQKFTIDHRDCGLFVRLDFADDKTGN